MKAEISTFIQSAKNDFPNFYAGFNQLVGLDSELIKHPDKKTADNEPIIPCPDYIKSGILANRCGISAENLLIWLKRGKKEAEGQSFFHPRWNNVYKLLTSFSQADTIDQKIKTNHLSLGMLFNQSPRLFQEDCVDEYMLYSKLKLSYGAIKAIKDMSESQKIFFEYYFLSPDFLPAVLNVLEQYVYKCADISQKIYDLQQYSTLSILERVKKTIVLDTELSSQRQQTLASVSDILRQFFDKMPYNHTHDDFEQPALYANPFSFDFAKGLHRLLEREQIGSADLAQKLNITESAVRHWLQFKPKTSNNSVTAEHTGIPSFKMIIKICEIYHVDIDYLFGTSDWTSRENWCIAHDLQLTQERTIHYLANLSDISTYVLNQLIEQYLSNSSSLSEKLYVLNVARYCHIRFTKNSASQNNINPPTDVVYLDSRAIEHFGKYIAKRFHLSFSKDFPLFDDVIITIAPQNPDAPPNTIPPEIAEYYPYRHPYDWSELTAADFRNLLYDVDFWQCLVNMLLEEINVEFSKIIGQILDKMNDIPFDIQPPKPNGHAAAKSDPLTPPPQTTEIEGKTNISRDPDFQEFYRPEQKDFPNFFKGLDRVLSFYPEISSASNREKSRFLAEFCHMSQDTTLNWFRTDKREENQNGEKSNYAPRWDTVKKLLFSLDYFNDWCGFPLQNGDFSLGFLFNQDEFYYNPYNWEELCYNCNLCYETIWEIKNMSRHQRLLLELFLSVPDFLPAILKHIKVFHNNYSYASSQLWYNWGPLSVDEIKETLMWTTEQIRCRENTLYDIEQTIHTFLADFPSNIDDERFAFSHELYSYPTKFDFPAGLSRLRQSRNITISELAQKADVQESTVYSWLSNTKAKIPGISDVDKICKAFDVDIDYLFNCSNWTKRENWCIAQELGFLHESTIVYLKNLDDDGSFVLDELLTNQFHLFTSLTKKISLINSARFFYIWVHPEKVSNDREWLYKLINIPIGGNYAAELFSEYIPQFLNLTFSRDFDLHDFTISINPKTEADSPMTEFDVVPFMDNDFGLPELEWDNDFGLPELEWNYVHDFSAMQPEEFQLLLEDPDFWKFLADMLQKEFEDELIIFCSQVMDALSSID